MKGRGTTTVGIRLEDSIVIALRKRAKPMGLTVGQYIKGQIMKSVSANTIRPQLYNPLIHKAGDKVLIRQGKRFIEQIVPNLDGDGELIPDV